MNRIRGKPHSSREVRLRDNVETFHIGEVEGAFRWDFPHGMKDGTDISYKKTFHVC